MTGNFSHLGGGNFCALRQALLKPVPTMVQAKQKQGKTLGEQEPIGTMCLEISYSVAIGVMNQ